MEVLVFLGRISVGGCFSGRVRLLGSRDFGNLKVPKKKLCVKFRVSCDRDGDVPSFIHSSSLSSKSSFRRFIFAVYVSLHQFALVYTTLHYINVH